MIRRPQSRPEQERVDHALVAEDHLPGEHPQQVARQKRSDQDEQEDVLALGPGERQVVRERVREHDDDRRDDQRHLHRLPEQPEVHRAMKEVAPRVERESVLAREQRIDVEAVRGDDRDRHDEEDDEPRRPAARAVSASSSRAAAVAAAQATAMSAVLTNVRVRTPSPFPHLCVERAARDVAVEVRVRLGDGLRVGQLRARCSRSLDAGARSVFAWP